MQGLVWKHLQQLRLLQPNGGNTPDVRQLTDGQTDWSMLTVARCSPLERNQVPTRAATWASLPNTPVMEDGTHEGHALRVSESFHVRDGKQFRGGSRGMAGEEAGDRFDR